MNENTKFADLFDAIICICMDSEEETWQKQCVPQFEKLDIKENDVIRHPGGNKTDFKNAHGCCVAHYNVLKLCKEKQFKRPLILESDFHLTYKFSLEKIQNALISLEKLDWNILSLGGKVKYNPELINDYIIKTAFEYTQAIVYNGIYIGEILEKVENSLRHTPRFNIDQIYSRCKYGILHKSYMTKDLCILQAGDKKSYKRSRLAKKVHRIKMGRIIGL
jgi:hypothetical protein